MKAWLTIVFWSRLPVKYWTEKWNETTVRTCAFWGSFGSISELPFVRKHFRASVCPEVLPSFRSFEYIFEFPCVQKYFRASVRSEVLPNFRSFESTTKLPFVRMYYRASVRSEVLTSEATTLQQGNGRYLGEDEWHHIKSARLSLLCKGGSITEPCVKFELKLSFYLVLIES